MTIQQDLAANRAVYQNYFPTSQRAEEALLPNSPSLLEQPSYVFSDVEASLSPPTYRLKPTSAPFPSPREKDVSSPDGDELLEQMVYRLERESRLASQPLIHD